VDDTPHNAEDNYGNYVHIPRFNGYQQDTWLDKLGEYLARLASAPNFRVIEKRHWANE